MTVQNGLHAALYLFRYKTSVPIPSLTWEGAREAQPGSLLNEKSGSSLSGTQQVVFSASIVGL